MKKNNVIINNLCNTVNNVYPTPAQSVCYLKKFIYLIKISDYHNNNIR